MSMENSEIPEFFLFSEIAQLFVIFLNKQLFPTDK